MHAVDDNSADDAGEDVVSSPGRCIGTSARTFFCAGYFVGVDVISISAADPRPCTVANDRELNAAQQT